MGKTRKASQKVSMTLAGTRSRRAIPLSAKGANYLAANESRRLKKLARSIHKLLRAHEKDSAVQKAALEAYLARDKERTLAFAETKVLLERELAQINEGAEGNNENAGMNDLVKHMAALPLGVRVPNAANALAANLERVRI